MTAEFVVDRAGCASCGELVREALANLGTVEAVVVDEGADIATVRLSSTRLVTAEEVDRALADASVGSGHDYGVRQGSWAEIV